MWRVKWAEVKTNYLMESCPNIRRVWAWCVCTRSIKIMLRASVFRATFRVAGWSVFRVESLQQYANSSFTCLWLVSSYPPVMMEMSFQWAGAWSWSGFIFSPSSSLHSGGSGTLAGMVFLLARKFPILWMCVWMCVCVCECVCGTWVKVIKCKLRMRPERQHQLQHHQHSGKGRKSKIYPRPSKREEGWRIKCGDDLLIHCYNVQTCSLSFSLYLSLFLSLYRNWEWKVSTEAEARKMAQKINSTATGKRVLMKIPTLYFIHFTVGTPLFQVEWADVLRQCCWWAAVCFRAVHAALCFVRWWASALTPGDRQPRPVETRFDYDSYDNDEHREP